MKETIILYLVGVLSKKQLIEASILYYNIDFEERRGEIIYEILEEAHSPEIIANMMANSVYKCKWTD